MAVSDTTPLTFDLPDGDHVELCTWAFVLNTLTDVITPINQALTTGNNAMDRIITKLDSWIDDN